MSGISMRFKKNKKTGTGKHVFVEKTWKTRENYRQTHKSTVNICWFIP